MSNNESLKKMASYAILPYLYFASFGLTLRLAEGHVRTTDWQQINFHHALIWGYLFVFFLWGSKGHDLYDNGKPISRASVLDSVKGYVAEFFFFFAGEIYVLWHVLIMYLPVLYLQGLVKFCHQMIFKG